MKKLLTAVLITSSLFGSIATNPVEAAPPKCGKEVKRFALKLPNLKDANTLKALKSGQFKYKGVSIGSKINPAHQKLGPVEKNIIRDEYGAGISYAYENGNIIGHSFNRYASLDDIKVTGMMFTYEVNESVERKDIERILGKPSSKDTEGDYSYDNKYGKVEITYIKVKKKWYVESVELMDQSMTSSDKTYKTKPSKFKNKAFKSYTKAQLKAMKNGTFHLYQVKPGLTKAQVEILYGESHSDEYQYFPDEHRFIHTYGVEGRLSLYYEKKKCKGPFMLTEIDMGYDDYKTKLSFIYDALGKPKRSLTELGYKTLYYPNVTVNLEEQNDTWYVTSISYKK